MTATPADWRELRGAACVAPPPSPSGHICKPPRPAEPRVVFPKAPCIPQSAPVPVPGDGASDGPARSCSHVRSPLRRARLLEPVATAATVCSQPGVSPVTGSQPLGSSSKEPRSHIVLPGRGWLRWLARPDLASQLEISASPASIPASITEHPPPPALCKGRQVMTDGRTVERVYGKRTAASAKQ
jgi:hypothetical protein